MTQQDIRLKDMQILDKVNILEGMLAKAELDVEYSVKVAWGDNGATQLTAEMSALIKNARTLFQNGRIDNLDPDVRTDTYAKYHTLLDSYIKLFPEYQHEDEITESVTHQM